MLQELVNLTSSNLYKKTGARKAGLCYCFNSLSASMRNIFSEVPVTFVSPHLPIIIDFGAVF